MTMGISAETVKTLRERTGAGMMECKKALLETGGDLDAAAETLRKAGLAKADKKAGRIAAEGAIALAKSKDGKRAALVEVNSETDFVARQPAFQSFGADIAEAVLAASTTEPEAVAALKLRDGRTVEETRRDLVAKIGEKIDVRRAGTLSSSERLGVYVHGGRIGTLVAITGGDDELARNLAMHVAWANPQYLTPADVPAEVVAKEREIQTAKASIEGKSPEITAKIAEGRLQKYLAEISFTGQALEQHPEKLPVGKVLSASGAKITSLLRFEVGEGIEKKQGNFAADVQAQIEAAKDKNKDKDKDKPGPDKPN
jgi:elongation factor Ts